MTRVAERESRWADLFPEGRVIYYEGDDPEGFVAEIKKRFNFDPSADDGWSYVANGLPPFRRFFCPAHLLDRIYGDGNYPMGS
jgi:hypothetical protein